MPVNQIFIAELKSESKGTKRILERVPLDKAGWKPHEKSFPLGRLATHVAEISGWTTVTLDTNELDFAKMDYKQRVAKDMAELISIFEENYNKAMDTLKKASDQKFSEMWTLRNGETIYMTLPKSVVLRSFAFNHLYHHRAQLSVYLRLLDVPVPGLYGPTADEPM